MNAASSCRSILDGEREGERFMLRWVLTDGAGASSPRSQLRGKPSSDKSEERSAGGGMDVSEVPAGSMVEVPQPMHLRGLFHTQSYGHFLRDNMQVRMLA